MINLCYEIGICQKIYNRVKTHNKSKSLVGNSLMHQMLSQNMLSMLNKKTHHLMKFLSLEKNEHNGNYCL